MMIPVHHRTFFHGLEPTPMYAQELLAKIIHEKGYKDCIKILDIGEQVILHE